MIALEIQFEEGEWSPSGSVCAQISGEKKKLKKKQRTPPPTPLQKLADRTVKEKEVDRDAKVKEEGAAFY